MNLADRRNLRALEAIAENERITQRGLSTSLGIALGLTNLYLKRLVRKGYVKCVSIRSNRLLYLVTPKGVAEKARLTYEFMEYSLDLYGRVRQHLRAVLHPLASGDRKRVAIYGTGEAAELAYLSLMELGFELVAVFDSESESTFLGMPVRNVSELGDSHCDFIIAATLDGPEAMVAKLAGHGVSRQKILTLRGHLS